MKVSPPCLVCVKREEAERLLRFVSPDNLFSSREQVLLNTFERGERKIQWSMGRLAGKMALMEISSGASFDEGMAPAATWRMPLFSSFEILAESDGAPLSPSRDLSLSISHTPRMAAAAASFRKNAVVGIDLELVRPLSRKVVKRFLHLAEEKEIARRFSDPGEGALVFWCLKEAAMKALRKVGVSQFKKLQVKLHDDGSATIVSAAGNLAGRWEARGDHLLAWAVSNGSSSSTKR